MNWFITALPTLLFRPSCWQFFLRSVGWNVLGKNIQLLAIFKFRNTCSNQLNSENSENMDVSEVDSGSSFDPVVIPDAEKHDPKDWGFEAFPSYECVICSSVEVELQVGQAADQQRNNHKLMGLICLIQPSFVLGKPGMSCLVCFCQSLWFISQFKFCFSVVVIFYDHYIIWRVLASSQLEKDFFGCWKR